MSLLSQGAIAPAIVVFPFAILVLVILAVHAAILFRTEMPPSRRRIRLANAALMLFTTPIIAYGFGWIDPTVQKRPFVVTWTLIAGLVVLILFLAVFDAINNLRIQRQEMKRLRQEAFSTSGGARSHDAAA